MSTRASTDAAIDMSPTSVHLQNPFMPAQLGNTPPPPSTPTPTATPTATQTTTAPQDDEHEHFSHRAPWLRAMCAASGLDARGARRQQQRPPRNSRGVPATPAICQPSSKTKRNQGAGCQRRARVGGLSNDGHWRRQRWCAHWGGGGGANPTRPRPPPGRAACSPKPSTQPAAPRAPVRDPVTQPPAPRRPADLRAMQLAGLAGLVGGALSMACGEYISVSSQKDAEEVRRPPRDGGPVPGTALCRRPRCRRRGGTGPAKRPGHAWERASGTTGVPQTRSRQARGRRRSIPHLPSPFQIPI